MTTEIEDLRLVWPASLFQVEARALVATGYATEVDAVRFLFAEAFAGDTGENLVHEVCETMAPYRGRWQPGAPIAVDPWDLAEAPVNRRGEPETRQQQLLEEVLQRVADDQIPAFARKRYWPQRQQPLPARELMDFRQLRVEFLALLKELDQTGYLDSVAGPNCCDAHVDRDIDGAAALEQRWGRSAMWPLSDGGDTWAAGLDEDDFLGLIEVFHDMVARPRKRRWHDFCHEWDYSDHDSRAGKRVYVWRINSLLERSTVHLRLADVGEDAGLLVRTVPDDRAQLPEAVAAAIRDPDERARVEHATAQHRTRHPSRSSRREAVRNLGDVLENRRAQAKGFLRSKDERDLFNVINGFDIRHMNMNQKADFGDEFLDYLYWTFLATIDLIGKLEARDHHEEA